MKSSAFYQHYTTWQLALDDDFIRWVKTPDAGLNAFWEQFLQDYPEKALTVQEARSLLLHYRFAQTPVEPAVVERIWQQLELQHRSLSARPRRAVLRRLIWYAAASVLLLIAGVCSYRYLANTATVIETQAGELRRISFPDGSQIMLNQQSKLVYHRFSPHQVTLEGEAYFSVPTRPHAPVFTVRCDKGEIRVLGTAFNVRSRQQQLQVVLEQGAVQVNPAMRNARAVKMQPGDMVVMDDKGMRSKKVHTQWHTAWRSNQLVFSNAPVEEILGYLTDTYGWHFKINAPVTLTNKRFNGTAPANEPDQLLQKISTIYQLKTTRQKDTVIVDAR
ncbi:FecR domain-containing protein [uncultured Chitinophaga sp.]|jgi:Fe2+-dicitrate sensor, membrane component|uniref:FecR domain-containing protein n=1 Tax=uncultured Chitinophaga sp. TaxID=339340 RepID=UPI00261A7E65|nr:FecR domain-containing protein [uncultured Chitinophaga sp.]